MKTHNLDDATYQRVQEYARACKQSSYKLELDFPKFTKDEIKQLCKHLGMLAIKVSRSSTPKDLIKKLPNIKQTTYLKEESKRFKKTIKLVSYNYYRDPEFSHFLHHLFPTPQGRLEAARITKALDVNGELGELQ